MLRIPVSVKSQPYIWACGLRILTEKQMLFHQKIQSTVSKDLTEKPPFSGFA